ncbi:MAG: bifunctional aspartate kinase/homoserine dehydrogenase I, partial [Cyclobacteriaceae bacterium]
LSAFNLDFDKLRDQAQKNNQKLRYMAILEGGKASVSLASVGTSHPFYSLAGSDNIILLTTERYKERPMVIRGPGAGAEVTAAGVFADVIRIGNYSN